MKTIVIFTFLLFASTSAFAQSPLEEANSWAYQLQNLDVNQVSNDTTFKLIVMDYSANGRPDGVYTTQQISQIKSSGKKAICYLSIGEAEDYRFYWQDACDADNNGIPDATAPAWLGPENPEWEGNYKVRYWQPEWQNLVFSYIDTVYAQGFDGIYCDIIDAYEYWSDDRPEQPAADSLMISFILNIRAHISGLTSDPFLIVPQNGEEIIRGPHVTNDLKNAYFEAIDGIGVEDVFFPGDLNEDNPFKPATSRIQMLQEFSSLGLKVFSVDYLTNPVLIEQYLAEVSKYGFIPYVARRELDTLNPGITVAVEKAKKKVPRSYMLGQNYPNPFNPSTKISYSVPRPDFVTLKVYDELGREVQTLVNEFQLASEYSVTFGAKGLPSAIYSYRLRIGHNPFETKRMVLVH